MKAKLETNLVGVAGEYLVTRELSLRRYIASISLRNSRGINMIASTGDATKSINIQVKTNNSDTNNWILSKKSEGFFYENHFYILVSLNNLNERANFYIVPSKVVADYIRITHATWLKGNKHNGGARKDSNMRKFVDKDNKYLEAWNLLSL